MVCEERDALLYPKTLEAALTLATKHAPPATPNEPSDADDEWEDYEEVTNPYASPFGRLKLIRKAEDRQKRLLDACCGYEFDEKVVEAALADGAWPDGDPLADMTLPLPCTCASAYEIGQAYRAVCFLQKRGASLDVADGKGRGLLHCLALRRDYGGGCFDEGKTSAADVVEYLLTNGADAAALDDFGRTPLYYALGPLAEELFEGADDDGLLTRRGGFSGREQEERRTTVAVAVRLLELAPRSALVGGVEAARAREVAARWARAEEDVEATDSSEDEGRTARGFDQERFDRKCAANKRNKDRRKKAQIAAALIAALDVLAEDPDAGKADDLSRGAETKAMAATRLKAAEKERKSRTKRINGLAEAVMLYQVAAALSKGGGDGAAGAVALSNAAECGIRIAKHLPDDEASSVRRAHWLAKAVAQSGEALAEASLAVPIRVKTLHRRARALRDLGRGAEAVKDADEAVRLCDDETSKPMLQAMVRELAPRKKEAEEASERRAASERRFGAENGLVPRVSVPLVLDFVEALRLCSVATVCCGWAKAARDESERKKELWAAASDWARALYQGGGGTHAVPPKLRECHLLVAAHVLEQHYPESNGTHTMTQSLLDNLRVDATGLEVLEARRVVTFRDATKAPVEVQYPMSRSPTDDLDLLEPEELPYNARDSELRNGYGTRHQEYHARIRFNGVDVTVHNYFKFSVIRNGYGTQYRLRVDAVPAGSEPLSTQARVKTNFRGRDTDVPEEFDFVELDDAGSLLDFRDTFDDSRRPYDMGWRYEGSDDAWDLVSSAFFKDWRLMTQFRNPIGPKVGGRGASLLNTNPKADFLRFLLRLVGAPCKFTDCISSYPIVESDTIFETWKFALPDAPHPDTADDELRNGRQTQVINDFAAHRKREKQLKEKLEMRYVL